MESARILAQFKSEQGEPAGSPFDLPLDIAVDKLQLICNAFLKKDEKTPYAFFVHDTEIRTSLHQTLTELGGHIDTEKVLDIVYQPQAVFRVRPISRCTSSLPGHAEAVISTTFSPDGRYLASGSGDTTVRFWDINTETPQFVCQGHRHWVLCTAWSPDGKHLASGCKNGHIIIWNSITGKQSGKTLLGHRQWITCLVWEPFHLNPECRRLASASKDSDVRIWDIRLGQCLFSLTGHQQCVTCVKWGGTGNGILYTSSQDRTIKVWAADNGTLIRNLEGHGHWVNTLALSSDYVMRTGPFDPSEASIVFREVTESGEELSKRALKRYLDFVNQFEERLVSGSDDFTLFMWKPDTNKKPIAHMTGHQQLINDVKFSPDGTVVASASFDKSIRLWDGRTGKFIATLRGHVQSVYQVAFSADSRLMVSGSADSTLKVWNISTRKLEVDLPGHADEVFAVDWSPDGQRVVSGGKDKLLRIWRA